MSLTLLERVRVTPRQSAVSTVAESLARSALLRSKVNLGNRNKTKKKTGALAGLVAAGAGMLLFTGLAMLLGMGGPEQPLFCYTVAERDLSITVSERGNLQSQQETEIICELENLTYDRSGNSGTQILSIVLNGTMVREGDLLVELDSTALVERLDEQYLDVEEDRAEYIQTKLMYENQATQNETNLAEAKLQVKLTELEMQRYDDGKDGTYQIARREVELKVQEAKNQIQEAQAGRAMQQTNLSGVKKLHKLGYRGRGDLDQAIYKYLQAEDTLVKTTHALANASSNLRKLQEYDYPMEKLKLQGSLLTAERTLKQVERNNESRLAQARARMIGQERRLKREEEILDKYKSQLQKCKIFAPHDGMVVHANQRSRSGRSTIIGEGVFVRQRQKILTLPDLSRMQVKTAVHESVLDQVREGLPATISLDAFPDRSYPGAVKSVAVLPDQGGWLSSDVKVYETIVTIDQKVAQLKPGMTAVVEIHVDLLQEVLNVPVQAIVQIGRDNWCMVKTPAGLERRKVDLGRSNDKFVEIRAGLEAGEQVLLNPVDIWDQTQQLEQGNSAQEEKHEIRNPTSDR